MAKKATVSTPDTTDVVTPDFPEPTTHALMVIDMSGSMTALADDVRGGFNSYLEKLKTDAAATGMKYLLTVTLFDHRFFPHAVAAQLDDVEPLTSSNYMPEGMTALNDAIGKTLAEFDAQHGKLGKHERALLIINTDGAENNSTDFTAEQVRQLLDERGKSKRWGCVFLGAGVEAWETGNRYGIAKNTMATNQDKAGTRSVYDGLAAGTLSYARGMSAADSADVVRDTDGVLDSKVN